MMWNDLRVNDSEKAMSKDTQVKLLREGDYIAEVQLELIDDPDGWGPYLTVDEAKKLDRVREALRTGNTSAAGKLAKVFRLVPISAA